MSGPKDVQQRKPPLKVIMALLTNLGDFYKTLNSEPAKMMTEAKIGLLFEVLSKSEVHGSEIDEIYGFMIRFQAAMQPFWQENQEFCRRISEYIDQFRYDLI